MVPTEEVTAGLDWITKGIFLAVTGLFALINTGFWRMMGSMQKDIKDNEIKIEQQAKDFSQHQLYAEKQFVNQMTMARLYDVIEKIQEDLNAIRVMVAKKGH